MARVLKIVPMEKRIYYHDTDAGGVVYYANYLKYLEEARTVFMEEKGIPITSMHTEGFLYAVRKCDITYKSPARYGEMIVCVTALKEITAAQIIFTQSIREKESNRLIVKAEIALVSLTPDFKPTQISENIKSKLIS